MTLVTWTDERIEQLRSLWADHSASEIAAIMGGVTRNAIVGKVHRLNLSRKTTFTPGPRRQPAKNRDKAPSNSPARSVDVMRLRAERGRTITAPASAVEALNVSFDDLRSLKCRWITNDDSAAPLYCGHDVAAGTDWCPGHYVIVYTPASERRRERPKVAA